MKTTSIFKNIFAVAIALVMGMSFTSCSSADDEPVVAANEAITNATVTFTYTIPEELLKYAEITVVYNNDEGTDARWEPMLDNTFTVTYDLHKFPITAPVVMVYDTTNRPAKGVEVDWNLEMDVKVVKTVGGRTEVETNHETYKMSGNLAQGIEKLQRNVLDRTYAVKINRAGSVNFVH